MLRNRIKIDLVREIRDNCNFPYSPSAERVLALIGGNHYTGERIYENYSTQILNCPDCGDEVYGCSKHVCYHAEYQNDNGNLQDMNSAPPKDEDIKCEGCGQWGIVKTPCNFCGAPLDPVEVGETAWEPQGLVDVKVNVAPPTADDMLEVARQISYIWGRS